MEKSVINIFLCIAIIGLLLVFREFTLLPDRRFHVHVLPVGQGDGILLVTPSGKQVIIDGGPNMALLSEVENHLSFFDREIELLVLTHPDADHITALPEILRRFTVQKVLINGALHSSGRYEAFMHELTTRRIPVVFANPQTVIDFNDGVTLKVLWPHAATLGIKPKNANNPSVVIKAEYGKESILLTGDIEEETELAILQSGHDISSTVLKVAHHGSRTSSSTGFLLAVKPKLAIISAGKENPFNHPHPEIVSRFDNLGIKVRSTKTEGTISLVFDFDTGMIQTNEGTTSTRRTIQKILATQRKAIVSYLWKTTITTSSRAITKGWI